MDIADSIRGKLARAALFYRADAIAIIRERKQERELSALGARVIRPITVGREPFLKRAFGLPPILSFRARGRE